MIVSTTLQIVFRVFFDALAWSEEVSRYMLVWSTFLGATLAYKRSMHISVTFVRESFSQRVRKALRIARWFPRSSSSQWRSTLRWTTCRGSGNRFLPPCGFRCPSCTS
ncbi:TRAP transporter small permease [Halomonas sp.]|uniref:TRAP transporter small permease n=1 Tax=Halomonas sp. TaxID=1486246 RepID=UPI003A101FBB